MKIDMEKFTDEQLAAAALAAEAGFLTSLQQWMPREDALKAEEQVKWLRDTQQSLEIKIEMNETRELAEVTRSGSAAYDGGDLLFAV